MNFIKIWTLIPPCETFLLFFLINHCVLFFIFQIILGEIRTYMFAEKRTYQIKYWFKKYIFVKISKILRKKKIFSSRSCCSDKLSFKTLLVEFSRDFFWNIWLRVFSGPVTQKGYFTIKQKLFEDTSKRFTHP